MARMGQTGEATTTVPSAQLQVALGLAAQARQGEEASRPYTTLRCIYRSARLWTPTKGMSS
jgi:hypothetical protein